MWKHLRKIFLPGIILQSVLIGGGYATGREIVEYGGKFGAHGWIAGLTIFLGFTVLAFLTFEASRHYCAYDYKSLLRAMIGRGWIGYEITYLLLSIIIIAVMASAAGEILKETLAVSPWVGVVLIVVLVGLLNYMGEDFIALMKTIGSIALFIAFFIFSIAVFQDRGSTMVENFAGNDGLALSSLGSIIWTGILYVGYNLGVYPASFFTLRSLGSRKESLAAAVIAGLLMSIPWFLTFAALMGHYPDEQVMQAPVPWLRMLSGFGRFFIVVFGVVVGWTLVETATGVIHAFIDRVEVEYREKAGANLGGFRRAAISTLALLLAMGLSSVGIIDLIATGYSMMAYAMIAFFAIPLLWHSPKLLNKKGSR